MKLSGNPPGMPYREPLPGPVRRPRTSRRVRRGGRASAALSVRRQLDRRDRRQAIGGIAQFVLGLLVFGAAFLRPSAQNNYTNVSDWWLDHSNATRCASDQNNCTQATCGPSGSGQGPCLNWSEIPKRYQTTSPILRQLVTLHLLSDDHDGNDSDNMYFHPIIENGGGFNIVGNGFGDLICNTTLGTVTAKNRAANQVLSAASTSCPGTSLNLGHFIVNNTRGSYAWIASVSAWTGPITQPMQPISYPPGSANISPTEDDTWTTGDSLSIYEPYGIRIGDFGPVYEKIPGTAVPSVFYHISNGGVTDFNTSAKPSKLDGPVLWIESVSERFLTIENASGFETRTGFFNSETDDIWGGKQAGLATTGSLNGILIKGGMIGPASLVLGPGSVLDKDVILLGSVTYLTGMFEMGQVANLSTTTGIWGTGLMIGGDVLVKSVSGGPNLYGTGAIDVKCGGHVGYPGLQASNWLNDSGALTIGGLSVACNGNATTPTTNCNVPLSATNLSQNAGPQGFAENAWVPGCAGIGNMGP